MDTEKPRLMLFTPPLTDAEGWASRIETACKAGDVAAVLLRLAPADERSLINLIKAVAPPIQALNVAVIVEAEPSIAVRGGADGAHVNGDADLLRAARKAMPAGRSVGAGQLRARHDAMDAGEADVDYVMFGEPRADGSMLPLTAVVERASWWAEIFQTPCVAYAGDLEAVAPLAATGVEFIGLGDWVFHAEDPAALVREAETTITARYLLNQPA